LEIDILSGKTDPTKIFRKGLFAVIWLNTLN